MPKDLEEIEIYILSDVHIGDPLSNKKQINKFVEEVLAAPNRYVIVNGDIINNATKLSVSDTYEEELTPEEQIDAAEEVIARMKNRIIMVTEGNHEGRSYRTDGILIMKQVCKRLDIFDRYSTGPYLLFVSFGKSQNRTIRKMIYTIYGKHGSGGGKSAGAKANKLLEMMAIVDADIYIHSHTHMPLSFRQAFHRCDYRNRKVTKTEKIFVNTNAFLDYGGYGENAGFSPASIEYPKIILNGIERKANVLL